MSTVVVGDPGSRYRRGTQFADAQVVARRLSRARERELKKSDGNTGASVKIPITLAGIPVPPQDETKHFKLLGTTGTGKSTAICEILGAALARGDRAIIADPDGGYLRRFYSPRRGDLILNPFEPDSMKWDLFGEMNSIKDVDLVVQALIPEGDVGSAREWRGYARTFLSSVTGQLWEERDPARRSIDELFRLVTHADIDELRVLLDHTPASSFLHPDNERMFGSVRSVAGSAVNALKHIVPQQAPPLSVRQWVQSEGAQTAPDASRPHGGVLFIPYAADEIPALKSTISAWMRLAIVETMKQGEGDRRLWFVVDELDALGQIDGLKDALPRLRKFGGRCVLGFQSIAQVSSTYGQGNAHTIIENCGNSLILRSSASEGGGTAKFASQLIGQREVLRTTRSKSRAPGHILSSVTRSEHVNVELAVLDSEIEQLPDLIGFQKFATVPQWMRVSLTPHRFRETPASLRRNQLKRSFAAMSVAAVSSRLGGDAGVPSSPTETTQGTVEKTTEKTTKEAASAFRQRKRAAPENSITYASSDRAHSRTQPKAHSFLADGWRALARAWVERRAPQPDTVTVPDEVEQQFERAGGNNYFSREDGTLAFRDRGKSLLAHREDAKVIESLVKIAEARQWHSLVVKGTEQFRREIWREAVAAGLKVRGYQPTAAERAQLANERAERAHQPETPSPATSKSAPSSTDIAVGSVSPISLDANIAMATRNREQLVHALKHKQRRQEAHSHPSHTHEVPQAGL